MGATERFEATGDRAAVLIVGAGPTGLALACGLARAGVAFRIVEAAPGPQPGSRGKGLQPRTLEVFDDFGIVDRVLANGRMAMPTRFVGPDGSETSGGTEELPDRPDIPYRATVITPQWRTEEFLRSRLEELGGHVEFGSEVTALSQSPSAVSATISRAGANETIVARYLVGCDGGHSLVRRATGISFDGETRDEIRMIVADVEVDGLDREAWRIWRKDDGLVFLCPLPSTNVFQYQAGIGPDQNAALALDNLQAILERRSGRHDIRLHEPQWSSLWRANIRLVERYRDRRIFLAGDAAHVHSPAGGQGMNTGIQDAYNLGWKLAAVENGAAEELLDTYEAERRPIAIGVLRLSNERLARAINETTVPTGRDAATMQLDLNYRGSSLAIDDRSDASPLRAGDRAPDATHLTTPDGERRLFDLTRGGRFTLLAFGAPVAAPASRFDLRTIHVVTRAPGPGEVADAHGNLARAYGAGAETLVLIRPDGYIGLISDAGDATAVRDYLAAIEFGPHRSGAVHAST